VGSHISRRTIRRIVNAHYKRKWKSMDRVKLTPESAKARLDFARNWIRDIEKLKRVC
jgi:hypothetical protein